MVDADNSENTLLVLKVKVFKLRKVLDIFAPHLIFVNIKISYPCQMCKIVSYT